MDSKPLLFGLAGFFLGGFIVSVAATTFDKPTVQIDSTSMAAMTEDLKTKTGDDYDKAFIAHMIDHHDAAVEMAELSAGNARHEEIKQLSTNIVKAQTEEIDQMREWQGEWGYGEHEGGSH